MYAKVGAPSSCRRVLHFGFGFWPNYFLFEAGGKGSSVLLYRFRHAIQYCIILDHTTLSCTIAYSIILYSASGASCSEAHCSYVPISWSWGLICSGVGETQSSWSVGIRLSGGLSFAVQRLGHFSSSNPTLHTGEP